MLGNSGEWSQEIDDVRPQSPPSRGGSGTPPWGTSGERGAGHQKNFVNHMFSYAVFDMKATYSH